MNTQIITPVDRTVPVVEGNIASEKLISGNAATSLWNSYTDKTEQFNVGQWSSEPCKLNVSYSENELCVLVKGTAEIENQEGEKWTFHQGDAFVIPAGFVGTWESVTSVCKVYAAFETA